MAGAGSRQCSQPLHARSLSEDMTMASEAREKAIHLRNGTREVRRTTVFNRISRSEISLSASIGDFSFNLDRRFLFQSRS